jgi:hypothetical protein
MRVGSAWLVLFVIGLAAACGRNPAKEGRPLPVPSGLPPVFEFTRSYVRARFGLDPKPQGGGGRTDRCGRGRFPRSRSR